VAEDAAAAKTKPMWRGRKKEFLVDYRDEEEEEVKEKNNQTRAEALRGDVEEVSLPKALLSDKHSLTTTSLAIGRCRHLASDNFVIVNCVAMIKKKKIYIYIYIYIYI